LTPRPGVIRLKQGFVQRDANLWFMIASGDPLVLSEPPSFLKGGWLGFAHDDLIVRAAKDLLRFEHCD